MSSFEELQDDDDELEPILGHNGKPTPEAEDQKATAPNASGADATTEVTAEYSASTLDLDPKQLALLAPPTRGFQEEGGRSDEIGGEPGDCSHCDLLKNYANVHEALLISSEDVVRLKGMLAAQETVVQEQLHEPGNSFNCDHTNRVTEPKNELATSTPNLIPAPAGQRQGPNVRLRRSAGLVLALLGCVAGLYFLYSKYVDTRRDPQHTQETAVQIQNEPDYTRRKLSNFQGGEVPLAGAAQTTLGAETQQNQVQPQPPPTQQQYDAAASMLRTMQVNLPPLYDRMPEFQQYTQALIGFNAALAIVPEDRRSDLIFAANVDEVALQNPEVCATDLVYHDGGYYALHIDRDEHDVTRTDLKAEAERLQTCTPALHDRVYYEWTHPPVDWDKATAEQQVGQGN